MNSIYDKEKIEGEKKKEKEKNENIQGKLPMGKTTTGNRSSRCQIRPIAWVY